MPKNAKLFMESDVAYNKLLIYIMWRLRKTIGRLSKSKLQLKVTMVTQLNILFIVAIGWNFRPSALR